ncbi:hypothetical protein HPB47_012244 [Ixodes persulcatus]|uniref:Uncharacterized protein n=1 Tax=Ixodes persulcatus TaxID=34615 RepID=A0AC60NU53_IXOPE|nr:hypothetical protein HPB47_012244 [Ixodes persulcatus]
MVIETLEHRGAETRDFKSKRQPLLTRPVRLPKHLLLSDRRKLVMKYGYKLRMMPSAVLNRMNHVQPMDRAATPTTAAEDAVCVDTVVLTNQAPASQGSDTNADDTGQEDDDASDCQAVATSSTVSASESPKLGLGRDRSSWASKDPEAEASQLQALANERARALAYVGAYKLADVTEATWHEEKIVLTRHKGHFLSFMGRAVGRRTLLHPLETLFLVESGQLTLEAGRRSGPQSRLPKLRPRPRVRRSAPPPKTATTTNDDVVCHEDNDSVLDVVPVIPAKQAKTDAAELNSSVPDPAVGATDRPPRTTATRGASASPPSGLRPPLIPAQGGLAAGTADARPARRGRGPPVDGPHQARGVSLAGPLPGRHRCPSCRWCKRWTCQSCRHLRVAHARTLDVYLAAVDFRKTCPGPPEYRVAMVQVGRRGAHTARPGAQLTGGWGALVFASVDHVGPGALFALEPLWPPPPLHQGPDRTPPSPHLLHRPALLPSADVASLVCFKSTH